MSDRYREGALADWEVTMTVIVPALNAAGAVAAAKHQIDLNSVDDGDWEARRA